MPNPFYSNAGHFYAPQVKPALLNLSFIVDVANTNGLGLRSLAGPAIDAVYMHTSATPATGNPNPASGYIIVKTSGFHNRFLGAFSSWVAPVTGGSLTLSAGNAIVAGVPYQIVTLGTTTTAANWVSAGLPLGYTAAVGMSFIATTAAATGTGLGNATVKLIGSAGISRIEQVGNPQLELYGQTSAGPVGGQFIFKCLAPSFAGTAMDTHAHNLLIKGGQIASTTNDIAYYATDILGKEQATDATILGSASATKGGVIAASAGTPAGTISYAASAPADESIISLSLYFSDSAVTVSGQ